LPAVSFTETVTEWFPLESLRIVGISKETPVAEAMNPWNVLTSFPSRTMSALDGRIVLALS